MRSVYTVLIASLLVATAPALPLAQTPAPLGEVLARAAAYLDDYDQKFSAVISEEDYSQFWQVGSIAGPTRVRATKAQMLIVNAGHDDWLGFRDIYEVDGKPLPDHMARLEKLFAQSAPASADALAQARRIEEESARYNVGSLHRNINVPTMALVYLKRAHQPLSTFTAAGNDEVDGVRTTVVAFAETGHPTVVTGGDDRDLAARGRFWIDATGRVVRSELRFDDRVAATDATIDVTYAPQPKLPVWVPVTMTEHYAVSKSAETIDTKATYRDFRTVAVHVDVTIKKDGRDGGGGGGRASRPRR